MSVDHYENFPVASWLCPRPIRPAVVAIYHFARTADDLADEGAAPAEERRDALHRFRRALKRCWEPPGEGPDEWPQVFGPLRRAIANHGLPQEPLLKLLEAFEQDVGNPVYPDRATLLDYCDRSANPVGRLLLHLYGVDDAASLRQSDAICTALQLVNFWQDFSVDHPRGRCYLPHADARDHGLDPADLVDPNRLALLEDTAATRRLVADLCAWAGRLMQEGQTLALRLPGRAGWELRLVVQGGLRILEKIAAMDHCSLRHRPTLNRWDAPLMLWRALRMSAHA